MVLSVHLSNSFLSFLFFILLESFSGYAESDSVYPNVVKLLHVVWFLITTTKIRRVFYISKFFLTFLYKMFWKRYYKSFPVRVKIIAYNAVIIFCHLIEVAIFAVSNFFSLFYIAVFNIPISHIIIVLLFLLQSYNLFPYLQIFLNFFC